MSEIARLTLPPKTAETAEPRAAQALEGAARSLGFIPNMYANMANAPELLESYLAGYKLFRGEAGFTPAEQEVVFLTISRVNDCSYCMAAHSMIAEKVSKVPASDLDAVRRGAVLPDPKLQALARFTGLMVESRGRPTPADVSAFLAAGYTERHVLGVILAMSVKTISNSVNHVFHTELDPAFAGHSWAKAQAA